MRRTQQEVYSAKQNQDDSGPAILSDACLQSRRTFLCNGGLTAAAMALLQGPELLNERGWSDAAQSATPDLVRDTIKGLLAFIVPGPDIYSAHQGVSTPEPGANDANIVDVLIESLNLSAPSLPQFSATVAAILNDVAQQVNPSTGAAGAAAGPFLSPFARLSFPEKVKVFEVMESLEPLKNLAGVLPAVVAFLSYSEAGVFDPQTRTLIRQPVGWTISGYDGIADGRDEFKGYLSESAESERLGGKPCVT
jgi:hypothetical protein